MTTIPEHCVNLRAPLQVIVKYLRFCVYSILHKREINFRDGYTCEIFEGMLLYVPKDTAMKSVIDTTINALLAWMRKNKKYELTFFVFNEESFELVERWVVEICTVSDGAPRLPTISNLMAGINEKLRTLRVLPGSCSFSLMLKNLVE